MSDNQVPISPLAPAVSPLLEADPGAINDLIAERIDDIFNTPPLARDAEGNFLLTDAKLVTIVEYYRKERLRFMQESAVKAAAGPKAPRKKVPGSVKEALTAAEDLI